MCALISLFQHNAANRLPTSSSFASYEQPFPIVIADSRSWNANFSNLYPDSDDNVPLTNPVYEFSVRACPTYMHGNLC